MEDVNFNGGHEGAEEGNEGAKEEGQYRGRRSTNGDCWVHREEISTEAKGRRKLSRKNKLFFLLCYFYFFKWRVFSVLH